MAGIMADNDVQGQFRNLLLLLRSQTWRDLWERLEITIETFETIGLARNTPDVVLWQTCQSREVVLFTGNRKNEGPDSLEAAIRMYNQVDSLPVITLSNADRFSWDRAYADKVAEGVMDILLNLSDRRGAGRLYVP